MPKTEGAGAMPSSSSRKRKVTIERKYKATIKDVWDLWTTKEGFESWWGPDGFSAKVAMVDLRSGGELHYSMTATAPAQIEFMKQAGMPLTVDARITYTEVVKHKRLAYTHLADFIPGVKPYDVATEVDFHVEGDVVRMVLTLDAMHAEEWTQRAVMGWESQLAKLSKIITS